MGRVAGDDRLIVALDFTAAGPALAMARQLRGLVRVAKVGSVLFTACGPAVIAKLRSMGFDVMLDLKFHDIPSTVELSCEAATRHRVALLTVHACGELAMLKAAVRGVRSAARRLRIRRPNVLGVTVLTSVEARATSSASRVMQLARRARAAGCDGVVASAHEAAALRRRFGRRLAIICPGIRLADGRDDQCRVATPREAIIGGADWLVVGRPITAARDPRAAARRMLSEMEDATR